MNQDIKQYARERKVSLREIAGAMGVSERTINRRLQTPADQETRNALIAAIDQVFTQRAQKYAQAAQN